MPSSTHDAYLLRQHPELAQMSEYYASLGFDSPLLWAHSELSGEPAVATAALLHALLAEVIPPDNQTWWTAVRTRDVNVQNENLLAQADAALQTVEAAGVDLRVLTPLIRVIQAQVVRNIATLLDQGPEISCIPLPEGREAHWQLFTVDAEDAPAQQITGLYSSIDGWGGI